MSQSNLLSRRGLLTGGLMSSLVPERIRGAHRAAVRRNPNILYILCDDLGYGDVRHLNPNHCKIPTPNMDRLAREGVAFSDAHSGSSVCTPSRYGILTGRYSWRSRLQSGNVTGYSRPLIPESRLTVASLLKQAGYRTAMVGKWHLGLNWCPAVPDRPVGPSGPEPELGAVLTAESQRAFDNVNYSEPVNGGPVSIGFDYFYGVTAPDVPPFVRIENDRVVGQPDRYMRVIRSGVGYHDYDVRQLLPALARRASEFLERQASAGRSRTPFFLLFSLTAPHSPLVPTPEWIGRSGIGLYGDFVMQTDAVIGELLDCLDRNGLAENTIVFLTSDNGCAPYVGVTDRFGDDLRGKMREKSGDAAAIRELERAGHLASARYRGYKSDIWDGGHRIPFIVRWPGTTRPGTVCSHTICLTDLLATCADLTGMRLPDNAGEDSVSILPTLRRNRPVRNSVVHHSISGKFALREGKWKLILAPGSGGWSVPQDAAAAKLGLPPVQLYDMAADPGEKVNLQAKHPALVSHLLSSLRAHVERGRSTPGPAQPNDVQIDIWKKQES